jgi:hypothetical protein
MAHRLEKAHLYKYQEQLGNRLIGGIVLGWQFELMELYGDGVMDRMARQATETLLVIVPLFRLVL